MKSMTDQLAAISNMRAALKAAVNDGSVTDLEGAMRFLCTWENAVDEMVGITKARLEGQGY